MDAAVSYRRGGAVSWPPRSLAERTYKDIRRWTRMTKGGHFAALERPEELVQEIREFFRQLRGRCG